jgi:SAM-dependent methyltransferase
VPGCTFAIDWTMTEHTPYIHGFSEEEQQRLIDQNEVLAPYIYDRIDMSRVGHLVEVGCGVGAQMMYLLSRYPDLRITGIEQSARQIRKATVHLERFSGFRGRYRILEGDASLVSPGDEDRMDAALLVWVLEHVPAPLPLLRKIRQWLPAGQPLYITEVYHSSLGFYPPQPEVMTYWEDTLRCQRRLGGDPDVGLKLAGLLAEAGFNEVRTWTNTFLLDASNPAERQTLLRYWLDLMRSALHQTLENGDTSLERWQAVEAAMRKLMAKPEAVFYYSFIQAEARWSV